MQHTRSMSRSVARTLGLLLLASVPMVAVAQKLKERIAERYASNFDYPAMVKVYQDMVDKGKADDEVLRRLASAYARMGRADLAEATYAKLTAGSPTAQDLFNHAEVLRGSGRYEEATRLYARCLQMNPGDARAQAYVNDPDLLARLARDSNGATIRTLPINSSQADLGTTVMDDLLLFSSARGEGVGGRSPYAWDEQPYLNLYSAMLKGETAEEPAVMRKDVNSRFHDGVASFDSVADRLYFTRNNYVHGSKDLSGAGELKLGIYYTDVIVGEFGNPEWGNLVPFEHNNPEHNLGHPSVSHDGRRIYFVSDMPGGQGGTDIWYCDNQGNSWGAPRNMGPRVNTAGNELYPYIAPDSTLFFASNGHAGLGGLDLFRAKLVPAGVGTVFNLRAPMNTQYNDMGLVLINDSTGFFVSDRPGGVGSDDIYGCTLRPPTMFLAGRVIDKISRQPIDGAHLLIKNDRNEHMARLKLEQAPGGKFMADVDYSSRYVILASKQGYFQEKVTVNTDTDPLQGIVIEMSKYDYTAEGVVQHGETLAPMEGVRVMLCDPVDSVLEELVTDATGKYFFPLRTATDYRIRVEKDGFFKQSAQITTKNKAASVIRTDFNLFPLKVDQVVRIENIYYDLNKWDIRPDAALELDKLVQTLVDNPTVKIELSSHTDCRGADGYNRVLSQKRAKSAVGYLFSKGIAKGRVVSKGYGEACTEEQHQRNRRTEFKVLSK